jgi:hypothetical protein
MFCHWYPTKTCDWSNPVVRSSWQNVASPQLGWSSNREGRWRLRAPTWSGARMDGKVNICESLINAVNGNKPKVLTGALQSAHRLGPKGKWPGVRVSSSLTADDAPPANRRNLTHPMVWAWNVVSPYSSRKGKQLVREADGGAGMGGWKKRRPSCNEADKG